MEVMLFWTKSIGLRRMIMESSLMLLFRRGGLMIGLIDMRIRSCHTDCVAGAVIGLSKTENTRWNDYQEVLSYKPSRGVQGGCS
jgi:hypothetical protein